MRKFDQRLSIIQDEELRMEMIFSITDIIQNNGPGIIDSFKLSYEKENIVFAYLYEIARNPSRPFVEMLAAGALTLANFQPGVGRKPSMPQLPKSSDAIDKYFSDSHDNSILTAKNNNKYFKLRKLSSAELEILFERVQIAKNYNIHLQPFSVKMKRKIWKNVRGYLFLFFTVALIFITTPTLILPNTIRKNLLKKIPMGWINGLDEYPEHERALEWPDATRLL